MKHKTLFSRLFPTYFLISLIGLAFLLIISRLAFENFYYKETTTGLLQKARIIESAICEKLARKDYDSIADLVDSISKKSDNRITVVKPDGKVIADSHFNAKRMENHKNREEIMAALQGEVGKSMRYSSTLGKNQLYVAIPLKVDEKVIGALRKSVSVKVLRESLFSLTNKVLIWSLILLLILTYFIYYQAKKISFPLEKMKNQIDKFTKDEFMDKLELKGATTEEVASLFRAVQGMSEKLQVQFQKINKQKNEQLAVFSSMLEGVITIYPDMNIYHINKAALNLFNYEAQGSIKGTPLKDVVKSERIYRLAKQLLDDHQTVDNEFEYESGTVLNVHGTILQSEKTGMLGAVLVFNDITKMRELENHRKQFVANVSHELKTPLTAIQGYLETIREGDVDDKETLIKFLDIIYKHSTRLKTIIEDLLALSSIERESEIGGLKLEKQPILPVLENVISLCHEKAIKKNIVVTLAGENVEVNINIPLLEQAIINLLDNAIKYGPESSDVKIFTKKTDKNLQIIVKDNGQGIPKEHHERLFERFYSIDKARSRELGGSGLGLSIVKHIALSHGGNIRVESELGKGSSFIFEIPL